MASLLLTGVVVGRKYGKIARQVVTRLYLGKESTPVDVVAMPGCLYPRAPSSGESVVVSFLNEGTLDEAAYFLSVA